MAKLFFLPLLGFSFFFLTACGEPMTPGVDFNTSTGSEDDPNSPPGDNGGSGDNGDPDAPGGPGDPGEPGDPGDPGQPAFSPADLASLTLWLKSTEHQGILSDGYAMGQSGVSGITNLAQGDVNHVVMAGAPATYSRNTVSSKPSIMLCGAKTPGCASSFVDTGSQLKLSANYGTYSLLKGKDTVTPACASCGGSFTITALVKRTSPDNNVLLSNRDAASQLGPYISFPTQQTLFFSTDGESGTNTLRAPIKGIPDGLEVVTAVYSRRNGLKLYWQGNLVGFELLKTKGPSTQSAAMPTLGHKNAPITQKLHVFEYLEFQSDLAPQEVCDIHSYLNDNYNLDLSLSCKSM